MHRHGLSAGTPLLSALPHGHLPLGFFGKSNPIVTLSLETPHWLPTAWIRHLLWAVPGPPLQDFLITSQPLNNKVKTHSIIYSSLNGPGCGTSLSCLCCFLSLDYPLPCPPRNAYSLFERRRGASSVNSFLTLIFIEFTTFFFFCSPPVPYLGFYCNCLVYLSVPHGVQRAHCGSSHDLLIFIFPAHVIISSA